MDTGRLERIDWGTMEYGRALELMRRRHAQRVAGRVGDAIICVEHPRVFTLGRDAHRENILLSDQQMRRLGFEAYHIERRGDVFYHGPGMATVYLVVDLRARRIAVRALVDAVEDALVEVCRSFGVPARGDPASRGAWLGERKVGAIGMAIRHKVTLHGAAINVNTDLDDYRYLRPCGLEAPPTSLAHYLGRRLDMAEVFDRLYHSLARNLRAAQDTLGGDKLQAALA